MSEIKYVITSGGLKIAYQDEGESDTILIFIHGMGSTHLTWKNNIKYLKNHYRCLALDLPGHGKSSYPKNKCSLYELSEYIIEFIDILGLKSGNLIIVAHSMGAQIAIMLSLRFQALFNKMVLSAPAGLENFSFTQKTMLLNSTNLFKLPFVNPLQKAQESSGIFSEFDEHTVENSEYLSKENRDKYKSMMIHSMTSMINEPVYEHLQYIQIPVLILYGENDKFIPNRLFNISGTRDFAIREVKNIPSAKLEILKYSGHFVHFDQTQIFNDQLIKFISE